VLIDQSIEVGTFSLVRELGGVADEISSGVAPSVVIVSFNNIFLKFVDVNIFTNVTSEHF